MDSFFPRALVNGFADPSIPIAIRELFTNAFNIKNFIALHSETFAYCEKPIKVFLGIKYIM